MTNSLNHFRHELKNDFFIISLKVEVFVFFSIHSIVLYIIIIVTILDGEDTNVFRFHVFAFAYAFFCSLFEAFCHNLSRILKSHLRQEFCHNYLKIR
jgi:hypothetical protein